LRYDPAAVTTPPLQQSHRLAAVQDPIIPIVSRYIAETPGTISLGQGLVSWGPPPEALEAARAFGGDVEQHRYGAVEGEPELVAAIERKLRAENGITVAPDSRVFVTAGGNMAFMNAVFAVCDQGDEVLFPTPFYFNHEMAVVMAGVRPVSVPTDARFQIDPDRLAAAMTSRTRAVVTVSPNNPTGAVYPEALLREVNRLCGDRGIFHIHDEVYEYFTYDGLRHYSPASAAGAGAHTISLFSLSKAYGFASWRIGYMVVPEILSNAIRKIQDTNLICAPLVSQRAAVAALGVGRPYCQARLPALDRVRRSVRDLLSERPDLYTLGPLDGAFYAWLRLESTRAPLQIVERLVREHRVAAIPAVTFGTSDCALRLSYGALEPATVDAGLHRLVDGLTTLLEARGGRRTS
jgi:aspartate/methionine/tyrosine aminotransferase